MGLNGWYRSQEAAVDEFYLECRLLAVSQAGTTEVDQVRIYLEGIEGTLSMLKDGSLSSPGSVGMERRVEPGQDGAKFYQINVAAWKVGGHF